MGGTLFISPGYPAEMPFFVKGLANVGVRVLGLGDQPAGALPPMARSAVAAHLQVKNLWDEETTVELVKRWAPTVGGIDRVEVLWEPGMILGARIREALGLPGMTVAQTIPFRDKEAMKQVLDRAGIRTPRHFRATSEAEVRAAAEKLGYPLIIKPIAGAGSADTFRLENRAELEVALPKVQAREGDERRGVHRGRGVHVRHGLRERADPLRQHGLVPAEAARGPLAPVDLPPDHRRQGHQRPGARGRAHARPAGHPGARASATASPTWSGS